MEWKLNLKNVGVAMERGHVCVIHCWEKEGFNGTGRENGRVRRVKVGVWRRGAQYRRESLEERSTGITGEEKL